MNILDAVKETGMADRPHTKLYAVRDKKDLHLVWHSKQSGEYVSPVPLVAVLCSEWQPYHPEPEKCEACKEADMLTTVNSSHWELAKHLRRDHCTCKETK